MKKITIALFLLSVTVTYAIDESKDAVVTGYEFTRGASNNYHFGFNSSDGISRSEDGKNDAKDVLAIKGNVTWVAQDGSTYIMFFKADTKGFRPTIKRIAGP